MLNEAVEQALENISEQETQNQPEEQIQENTINEKVADEGYQAKNFKNLRREKEAIQRERDELARRLQEIEQKKQPNNKEDEIELAPDDLVEWKHVDKQIKNLENKIKGYQQESLVNATETKLKQQFPDFDKVVSVENIELLRDSYPEIAQTLNDSADLYNKAVSAYTLIKNFGIYKEDVFSNQRNLAQENSNKPKPLASVSPQKAESPLSKANMFAEGLTDELKKQLYKEMMDARR